MKRSHRLLAARLSLGLVLGSGLGCGESACRSHGCECSSNSDCDSNVCVVDGDDATCFDGDLGATGGASGTTGTGGTRASGGTPATGGASGTSGSAGTSATGGSAGEACDFRPDPPQSLEACAGDPAGTWRLTSMDATGMPFRLYADATTLSGECETELLNQTEKFDFVMAFGRDTSFTMAGEPFEISVEASDACFVETVGQSCTDVALSGSCSINGCELCECNLGAGEAFTSSAAWSSVDGKIFLDGSPYFDYCVEGDTLELLSEGGVRYSLERVYRTGRPAPCAERTAETCASLDDCSWNGSACTGYEAMACRLQDYDKVPGCTFVPAPASCTGTPPGCDTLGPTSCSEIPGCTPGSGLPCIGTPTPCAAHDLEMTCWRTPGCAVEPDP